MPIRWMLAGALCFTLMGVCTHAVRDALPWPLIALIRTCAALAIAALLTYAAGVKFAIWGPPILWLRSLAGSCSLVLTFFALTHAHSLAEVLVLTNMFPVWVALLSGPVLGAWPKSDAWLAIGLAMVGVIVLQQPDVRHGDALALFAAAAASLTTSLAMLGLHQLKQLDARSIVTHFSAVSALFCLVAWALSDAAPPSHWDASLRTGLLLTAVGVSATCGQLFLTKAFASGAPAKVSLVGLSQVVFSALADIWIWERSFTPSTLAGMALIVVPTLWIMLRGSERAPAATADE